MHNYETKLFLKISVFGRSFDEGEEAAKMIEDQGEETQILEAFTKYSTVYI